MKKYIVESKSGSTYVIDCSKMEDSMGELIFYLGDEVIARYKDYSSFRLINVDLTKDQEETAFRILLLNLVNGK